MWQIFHSPDFVEKPGNRWALLFFRGLLVPVLLVGGCLIISAAMQQQGVVHAAAFAAATKVYCNSKTTSASDGDIFGTYIWDKIQTKWCYDGTKITSRSWVFSWGVTTVGSINGWQVSNVYKYPTQCYVASGSNLKCSGVEESLYVSFKTTNGFTQFTHCQPQIDQWMDYKGHFRQHTAAPCS